MAALVAVALSGSTAAWLFARPATVPPPTIGTITLPAAAVAAAPDFDITTATEQEIRQHVATSMAVFRFAENPRILVLDFASLTEQGRMLNRIAAFVEKAGLPHDRVLTDVELDAAIRGQGDTVETFYSGHDYSAASLQQFFAAADSQGIELDRQEERLRALLQQERWFAADLAGGLISVPAVGSDASITAAVRAAILRHELSHGEFFSNAAYANYVHDFWLTELTETERAAVRSFLAKEDYDVNVDVLMYNEMQAYLMFTREPQLFTPEMVGLTGSRLTLLQDRFLAGMPAGWLRDVLAGYQENAPPNGDAISATPPR